MLRRKFIKPLFIAALVLGCLKSFSTSWAASQAKVQPGESVYSILKRHGFSDTQRNAALGSSTIPKNFVLSTGDMYRVANEKGGKTEVSFFQKNSLKAFTFWRDSKGNAGSNAKKMNYKVRVEKATGVIRGSLVESIAKATKDELIAYRFMDAFLFDYNLPRVVQKNAKFKIVFEKLYDGETFIQNGEVLQADLEILGETVSRRFERMPSGGVFVDKYKKRDKHASRQFYSPVDYVRISSLYSPRRFHPIKKYTKAHAGIDFELPEGEPVYAIGTGKVLRFGRNRGAGKFVVIRHGNGMESYYNHLSEISPKLRAGQQLSPTMAIGRIGCTGYCTKPHLHFAMKKGGRFVDPIKYLRPYSFNQRTVVEKLFAQND